jgi:hypothetical protein
MEAIGAALNASIDVDIRIVLLLLGMSALIQRQSVALLSSTAISHNCETLYSLWNFTYCDH